MKQFIFTIEMEVNIPTFNDVEYTMRWIEFTSIKVRLNAIEFYLAQDDVNFEKLTETDIENIQKEIKEMQISVEKLEELFEKTDENKTVIDEETKQLRRRNKNILNTLFH